MVIQADSNVEMVIPEDAGKEKLEDFSFPAEAFMAIPIVAALARPVGWLLSITMASGMTFVLFYFMQSLIATGAQLDQRITVVKIVDASMPEIALEVFEEFEKPEPIEKLAERLPESQDKRINLDPGPTLNIEYVTAELDTDIGLTMATISETDGDYLPLVAIAPQYPQRAIARDIEGWCLVSFTVNALGSVVEDSIEVVDAEPSSIFDSASIRAAARFNFLPRVMNGIAVAVPNVQYAFQYVIED